MKFVGYIFPAVTIDGVEHYPKIYRTDDGHVAQYGNERRDVTMGTQGTAFFNIFHLTAPKEDEIIVGLRPLRYAESPFKRVAWEFIQE